MSRECGPGAGGSSSTQCRTPGACAHTSRCCDSTADRRLRVLGFWGNSLDAAGTLVQHYNQQSPSESIQKEGQELAEIGAPHMHAMQINCFFAWHLRCNFEDAQRVTADKTRQLFPATLHEHISLKNTVVSTCQKLITMPRQQRHVWPRSDAVR